MSYRTDREKNARKKKSLNRDLQKNMTKRHNYDIIHMYEDRILKATHIHALILGKVNSLKHA